MKKLNFSKNTIPIAPPLAHGQGAVVIDIYGKKYIDFCSQTLNLNLGQCHPEITSAVVEQANKLTYSSTRFSSDIAIKLIEKLIEITPKNLTKVNLKDISGSTANENAIKAVRKYTGRDFLISVNNSHLGQTIETMKVSGKHWNTSYIKDRNVFFLQTPYCYRCPFEKYDENCDVECLDELENIYNTHKESICGLIIELVMVDAGVIVPPHKYHHKLRSLCNSFEIPLIYDEVQTAFGWLGSIFAMDYYGVNPDILTLGKGLGAGFPLAATIFSERYDVIEYGEHEITYGTHPISCAASVAMIEYLEKKGLEEAKKKSDYILNRLNILKNKYPRIGDIRHIGLIFGIEIIGKNKIPDSIATKIIHEKLLANGVIGRISKVGINSNVLQIKPPIVITIPEIDYAIDKLDSILSIIN